MRELTPVQAEAWSLMEGYSDAALTGTKERVTELLNCDPSDVNAMLANIGMERCGECGFWHAQSDCDIEHPDRSMDFICHSCAGHLSVEF